MRTTTYGNILEEPIGTLCLFGAWQLLIQGWFVFWRISGSNFWTIWNIWPFQILIDDIRQFLWIILCSMVLCFTFPCFTKLQAASCGGLIRRDTGERTEGPVDHSWDGFQIFSWEDIVFATHFSFYWEYKGTLGETGSKISILKTFEILAPDMGRKIAALRRWEVQLLPLPLQWLLHPWPHHSRDQEDHQVARGQQDGDVFLSHDGENHWNISSGYEADV